ncbi:hypothetical protein QE152_g30463 [Popillia japonica]|uniref:Uncharacterized protein n=1 Tax=Popillia japonica TaxID=7064 RepID=A0AAW1JDU9_POPJA
MLGTGDLKIKKNRRPKNQKKLFKIFDGQQESSVALATQTVQNGTSNIGTNHERVRPPLQFYKTILRHQQYARGTEAEGEDEYLPEELLCSPGKVKLNMQNHFQKRLNPSFSYKFR